MTRLGIALLAMAFSLCGADSYVVSGVVVDSQSRRPIANARVLLAPTSARVEKIEQVTKQDGQFSFAVIQAGKYTLQITKPGYPVQSYRSGVGGLSSAIVVRDGQDASHIVFDAKRGAALTGQIKDEDSDPVGNALISIFQSSVTGGERKVVMRGQTRTNDAGEFRIAGLQRGNYYVCAMGRPWFADSLLEFQELQEGAARAAARFQQRIAPPPQTGVPPHDDDPSDIGPEQSAKPQYSPDPNVRGTAFLTTFYPSSPVIEEASLVRLEPGAETKVAITLPFGKAFSVNGAIALSAGMGPGRANLFKKIRDQYVLFLQETVAADGKFKFKNVPAGSYEIVATSDSGSGASSWNARQEVLVGSSDLEVSLRPEGLGAVAGRVLFEGEPPSSIANFFVSLRNEQGNSLRMQVNSEGNFSASRLTPRSYEVTGGSADYVAAFLASPNGDHLPLTLEITSGDPVHRDLMLTKAVSVIEGAVEKADVPQVGAFVLLMPKNPAQRWAYRVDQTDSDGSYRLASIPSGDYYLIALSDGADLVYRDAKVAAKLIPAAKAVHIEPGDRLEMKLEIVGTAALHLPPL